MGTNPEDYIVTTTNNTLDTISGNWRYYDYPYYVPRKTMFWPEVKYNYVYIPELVKTKKDIIEIIKEYLEENIMSEDLNKIRNQQIMAFDTIVKTLADLPKDSQKVIIKTVKTFLNLKED